jgi:hypothetical protein
LLVNLFESYDDARTGEHQTVRRLKCWHFRTADNHLKVGSTSNYVDVFFVFLSREGRDTIGSYVAAPASTVGNVTLA